MFLLHRNLILQGKKPLQLHNKYNKLLIWKQLIALDAIKWPAPVGCFKEKLKNIYVCLYHHKIIPRICAALRNGMREQVYIRAVGAAWFCGWQVAGAAPFLCCRWKKKRHFGISNSELLVAFQLSWLARDQRTRNPERIKMFTLWFLAKTHKHNTFFMFWVALY